MLEGLVAYPTCFGWDFIFHGEKRLLPKMKSHSD